MSSQYLDFLVARIRTFLSDPRMKAVIGDGDDITLEKWLADYIGERRRRRRLRVGDRSVARSDRGRPRRHGRNRPHGVRGAAALPQTEQGDASPRCW